MWYNPWVTWLLRSPLRRLMENSTLLLTYTGRKSARSYTLPISYAQCGRCLRIITRRQKTWWKNVVPGAPVTLWLRGEARNGWAQVVPLSGDDRLAALLDVYHGLPRRQAERLLPDAVVVEVCLDPASAR
jgi:hypothetical protein